MRGDSSTIGGDPGELLERATQFLKRSGKPYAMTCKMGNATCASSAEDLEEALQYLLIKKRYCGVMMTLYYGSAWIVPTVRGCDKFDGL